MPCPSSPSAVLIAQTPDLSDLNKRIAWSAGENPVFPAYDECADGLWVKPSDVGFGRDATIDQRQYSYAVIVVDTDDLEHRFDLRNTAAQNNSASLVLGMPDPAQFDVVASQPLFAAGKPRIFGWAHLIGNAPRNHKLLKDEPRSWLTVDLDGLELPDNVVENDHALAAMISDVWDDAGLDWLIADCVIHLSSSHGMIGDHHARAHIEWHLDQPLSLSQQRAVAQHINAALAETGYGANVLDTSIYEPARLLFTAPPTTFRRQVVDGAVVDVPHPPPKLQRVRISRVSRPRITVPPECLEPLDPVSTPRSNIRPAGRLDGAFRPGNIHNASISAVYKTVHRTPAREHAERKEATLRWLEEQIAAVPATEAKLQQRLHELHATFDASWDGAVRKRYGAIHDAPPDKAVAYPLESARKLLPSYLRRTLKDAIEYVGERRYNISFLTPKPTYTLIKAPPGVGKTHALIEAIDGALLLSNKINVYTETVRLSEQVAGAARAKYADNDYALTRIRHEKGRTQSCHPDMDELCSAFEVHGVSPRGTICPTCPHQQDCPWPKQTPSAEPGITIGQHAHMTSTLQRIKRDDAETLADVHVIDESPVKAFLDARAPAKTLDELEQQTRKTVVRSNGKKKRVSHERTSDVREWRSRILTLLRSTPTHTLSCATVRHIEPWLDDARDAEQEVVTQNWAALEDMAKQGNYDAAEIEHYGQLKATAEVFLSLYRAIDSSIRIEQRDYVFGVRLGGGELRVELRGELAPALGYRSLVQMDATANPTIEASIWSATMNMHVIDLAIEAEHYTLTQYTDSQYANSKFLNEKNEPRRENSRRLACFIKRKAFTYKKVLVVATEPVETALKNTYTFPNHVHFEHFGNLKGVNDYEDCDAIIIVGRSMPPAHIIEAKAEALYYDSPNVAALNKSDADKPLPTKPEMRKMRGGKQIEVQQAYHPDENVNAVFDQMVWAECKQGLGRCRPLQRTARNPVDVTVFGTWDTGLEIDDVKDWREELEWKGQEILEMAGLVPSPSSVLMKRMLHNYFEGYAYKKLCEFTRFKTSMKKMAGWSRWRIRIDEGTYEDIYVSDEQSKFDPNIVAGLIEDRCKTQVLIKPRLLRHL